MSDRNELAALMKDRLREVYMTATGEKYDAAFIMDDDPLNDVVVDGHVDFIDLATTILARWRLVPVESGATRPPSETYNGHRDWPQPVEGWNYVTEETLDTGLVTRVYTTRSGCEA